MMNTGMMGSGKTTVGKLMSKVLGYSFFDWYVYLLLSSCVNKPLYVDVMNL